MEITIIKQHERLRNKRLIDSKTSTITKYILCFIIVFLVLFLISLGIGTAFLILDFGNVISSLEEVSSIIIIIDAFMKLMYLKPKINNLHPYLILPISIKSVIRETIISNIIDIRHYLSLFCIITMSVILYYNSMIEFSILINYLIFFIGLLLFNSLLSICFKQFNLFLTFVTGFLYILYFAVFFSLVKYNLFSIHLKDIIETSFVPISSLLFFILLFIFVEYKTLINYIYNENSRDKEYNLSLIDKILFVNIKIKLVLKMILRGKPLANIYIFGLFFIPIACSSHSTNYDIITKSMLVVFFSHLFTRFFNLHKLISCYVDGLITKTNNFFKFILSSAYSINIVYTLYCCIIFYYYSNDIYYSVECFFCGIGIGPLINFWSTIYDSGRYSIYSSLFNGQNIQYLYTNLKPNLIYFISIVIAVVLFSLINLHFQPKIAILIIVLHGLIVFFTKNIWLTKFNNIYIKNRYENLAKCRGEKFNK